MARCPRRRALALIDLLAAIAVLGTLMGLTFTAIQKIRESSDRLSCQNNMRQIGQALLNFHDQKKYFPPSQDGTATDAPTWMKLILPYISEDNAPIDQVVPVYVCPADQRPMVYEGAASSSAAKFNARTNDFQSTRVAPGTCQPGIIIANANASLTTSTVKYACSSYVAVVSSKNVNGPYDGTIYPNSRTRANDITDGQSNTVLVGERPPSKDLIWGWWASSFRGDNTMGAMNMYQFPIASSTGAMTTSSTGQCPAIPMFSPGSLSNPCDTEHFWSFHPTGGNWLFADGSVLFIQYRAATQIPLMASRAGGEVIDWLEVY